MGDRFTKPNGSSSQSGSVTVPLKMPPCLTLSLFDAPPDGALSFVSLLPETVLSSLKSWLRPGPREDAMASKEPTAQVSHRASASSISIAIV